MKESKQTIKDEDSELVSLCQKGDVDAFEVLVKKYQKRMLNTAYRMIGNYEDACEVTQDVFVSAFKNIKKFEKRSSLSTWLYVIVINLSRNRIQQLKRKFYYEKFSLDNPPSIDGDPVKKEHPSDEPSIVEKLEKKDVQKKIEKCLNSLDNEFREVLILRDKQGFSYNEIRDICKISEGTVKSRLFRARESIKNCLKQFLEEF